MGAGTPRWTRPLVEPECPAGWRTAPPDFVGVGAQRSGTSWWYRGAIRPHPRFVQSFTPGKELHYFDRHWQAGAVPEEALERYASYFPRPEGGFAGEWTPDYMCSPWILPALRRAAPQTRILIMLRDPIDRYASGITRELGLVEAGERPLSIAVAGDALNRSLYRRQVERAIELFGRDRVLVLQYERCLAEPLEEMRRTHAFVGVEPLAELPKRLVPEPAAVAPGSRLAPELRSELREWLAPDVLGLAELCPELDLGLWPNFADLASRDTEAG